MAHALGGFKILNNDFSELYGNIIVLDKYSVKYFAPSDEFFDKYLLYPFIKNLPTHPEA